MITKFVVLLVYTQNADCIVLGRFVNLPLRLLILSGKLSHTVAHEDCVGRCVGLCLGDLRICLATDDARQQIASCKTSGYQNNETANSKPTKGKQNYQEDINI